MALHQQTRGAGVEVLGTLALVAPKLDEFQFVKVQVDEEVARLTLDRPDHNLLNERMLCELATGINILGEQHNIKLIVLDSAGKTFCGGIELGEYTQRRVFQLLDAFHMALRGDAGYIEAAAGGGERAGARRRRGAGGAGRSGGCHSQGAIRAAGNQARSFSAAGRRDSSIHFGTEAGAGTRADWRSDVRRTCARIGTGELARARSRAAKESGTM